MSKIDEEIQITKLEKSIYLPLQEASLSLLSKMDVEVQITEIENQCLRSPKWLHNRSLRFLPFIHQLFSRVSQSSILVSTLSPSFSSLGTVSTPLKLSRDTYDRF